MGEKDGVGDGEGRRGSRSELNSDCLLDWEPTVCQAVGKKIQVKKSCFTWIVSSSPPPQALCQCYCPALTEKETETQRHYVTCPRSHSSSAMKPGS